MNIHNNRKLELLQIVPYLLEHTESLHCVGGIVYHLNIGRMHVENDWRILKALDVVRFVKEEDCGNGRKMKLHSVNVDAAKQLLAQLKDETKITTKDEVNTAFKQLWAALDVIAKAHNVESNEMLCLLNEKVNGVSAVSPSYSKSVANYSNL